MVIDLILGLGRGGDQVHSYRNVDGGREDLSHGGSQHQHGDKLWSCTEM